MLNSILLGRWQNGTVQLVQIAGDRGMTGSAPGRSLICQDLRSGYATSRSIARIPAAPTAYPT